MAVIESLPLPTAKKLIQTTPFAEAIFHLSVTKLPQLARYLDALLTLARSSTIANFGNPGGARWNWTIPAVVWKV